MLKKGLHRVDRVYICQNITFLEITCQVHLIMEVLVSCLLAGSMRFCPCNQLRIAMLLVGTIYKLINVKIW